MQELLFKIQNDEMMRRAIERARELRPRVRVIDASRRMFEVESRNNRNRYLVAFTVTPEGCRLASCRDQNGRACQGLTARSRCYHVAVAAAANIYAQAVRLELSAR